MTFQDHWPWRPIDKLPKVNTQYNFMLEDGTVIRGLMNPNGSFEEANGQSIERPVYFRFDDEIRS